MFSAPQKNMSDSKHSPSRWEKRGHTIQAKTVVFDVQSVSYRHPARGTEKNFVVVHAPDWVNVLALTPDGALVPGQLVGRMDGRYCCSTEVSTDR